MDTIKEIAKIKVISRKACLSDFVDNMEESKDRTNNNNNNNNNNNSESIQKNQKEYGHKKRIKP